MEIWLTSDQHFDHSNIIRHCGRPFADVDEMNSELVRRHNSVVSTDDVVWHLGDFCTRESRIQHWLSQLNGRHFLVPGNHDSCHPCHKRHTRAIRRYMEAGFDMDVEDEVQYFPWQVGGFEFAILSHFPRAMWAGEDSRYPEWRIADDDLVPSVVLCGHVHEKWKVRGDCVNVGVDQWDFTPVNLQTLKTFVLENCEVRR